MLVLIKIDLCNLLVLFNLLLIVIYPITIEFLSNNRLSDHILHSFLFLTYFSHSVLVVLKLPNLLLILIEECL